MDVDLKEILTLGLTAVSGVVAFLWKRIEDVKKELAPGIEYAEKQIGVLATQLAVQQNMLNNGDADRKEMKDRLKGIEAKLDRLLQRNGGK